jgi:hypothetical protein
MFADIEDTLTFTAFSKLHPKIRMYIKMFTTQKITKAFKTYLKQQELTISLWKSGTELSYAYT